MLANTVPLEQFATLFGIDAWLIGLLFVVITLWSVAWKAWSLWLAARRGEKWWFILLLIVNTIGILEIIYIFLVAKRSDQPKLK